MNNEDKKENPRRSLFPATRCQLAVACGLSVVGVLLLFFGFWVAPQGEIHQSVLIGFGEVSTFAGALFGVDYSYKYRYAKE